jgi:hypothetical protein
MQTCKTLAVAAASPPLPPEAFLPPDKEWVLRNLTTRELVHARALVFAPEGTAPGPLNELAFEGVRFVLKEFTKRQRVLLGGLGFSPRRGEDRRVR